VRCRGSPRARRDGIGKFRDHCDVADAASSQPITRKPGRA